jgi:L-ribulose-5-phosphate 4-epimerase
MVNMEGYTKFNCEWQKSGAIITDAVFKKINGWREILYDLKLIGVYKNGIGFGNISVRAKSESNFIITGTGTGKIRKLTQNHFSKVTDYSLTKNKLTCKGPVKASSESLSHAVIYEIDPEINAVIHGHNMEYWEKLIHIVPTTHKDVAYGTPEMAKEIIRLFRETDVSEKKILVMGGHQEGIYQYNNLTRCTAH